MAGNFLWGSFCSNARLSLYARRSFCKYDKSHGVSPEERIARKSYVAAIAADLCCRSLPQADGNL